MAEPAVQTAGRESAITRFAQKRPLTLFFLVAYAWGWTIWLIVPRFLRNVVRGTDNFDPFDIAVIMIGACGPTLAAFLTRWLIHRDLKICPVWTGCRRLIIGLGFGLSAFFAATVAVPAAALAKAPFYALHWSALLHWSTYRINYSTFLGGPVNEEPGWRGFALPQLQSRYGSVWASTIIAVLWAGWHLPLFLIPGWSSTNPWQFVLILLGVSFLLTAAANFARFGVLVAIVLHAFFNTSAGLLGALTNGLTPRPYPVVIYTFVVLVGGTGLGLLAFIGRKKAARQDSARVDSA